MTGKIKILFNKYKMFIRYLGVAILSFVIDISFFTLFNTVISFPIVLATIIARIISSFINYLCNKSYVFKSEENNQKTFIKYYTLVIIQMFISAFLVDNFYNMFSINATLIKIPVEFGLFIANYLIQKLFIFHKNKVDKRILVVLLSFLTTLSLASYLKLYIKNTYVVYACYIVLFLCLALFYERFYKKNNLSKKYHILSIIISFIFVLGYSYEMTETGRLFFGSINNFFLSTLKVIGYYFLIITIIYYLKLFLEKKFLKSKKKIIQKFSNKPFFYSFIFLLICYGIFLVFYYPGIINYDNANQIKEVFNIHTRYLDAIIPVSSSTLTNFNPIIHTLLLGGLVKLGVHLGSFNFGLFMYTFLQMLICILIYSYTISYAVKKKVNPLFTFIALLSLGLIPVFSFYSITAVKDTLYTAFLVLYSVKLYDYVKKDKHEFKDYLLLWLVSMLVCLFRNNGIFIVLLSLPFVINKENILKISSILCTVLIVYFGFTNYLLPTLGVSGTSIRETLSIPFQQTARLYKYKREAFSEEDALIVSRILDYDNLANDYNKDLADPVKNKFNKYATKEDLINYFKVWFKGLGKEPFIYIDATINNVSGYFYPYLNSWKVYHKLNHKLPDAGFDYHYIEKLELGRDILHKYEKVVEFSPVGLLLNIAILSWLSIIIFVMLINKKKSYIFMLPNIISILFCILSPANTYFRYIYPTLVLLVTLLPLIKLECENNVVKTIK